MHTQDYTKGNLYRHLITLSLPLIAGNILQQFYNTIDAFVVGYYAGNEEFAAIGIAGTVMNLFLFMIVGACTGISVLFARYYGMKNYEMLHKQHFTSLVTGLCFSVILCFTGLLCMNPILKFIQTPGELFNYVIIYLTWIFISLPAAFIYNMYAAALRAAGDTVASLCILAAAVFLNLILDIIFVAHFNLGIQGAAQATALTQLMSAVLCIIYIMFFHKELIFKKSECKLNKTFINSTLQCSMVTAIHQAGLYIGKALVQRVVNTGGTQIIAAYTAATRIEGFANSFGDSGSAATSVIVSQNFGVSDKKRIRKSFKTSLSVSLVFGILCSLILFCTAGFTVKLMLNGSSSSVITHASAVSYLKIIAIFYTVCFTGGTFTGCYNGLGKVYITLIGTIGQITMRVILSWILFKHMQLNAVAVATGIGWLAANIFWLVNYIRISRSALH